MNRVYYIECKIDGKNEKFRFANKKALEKYIASGKAAVLRCSNVTGVNVYSIEENK